MTLTEAITEEKRRYVYQCSEAARPVNRYTEYHRRRAHIHYLAFRRLQHLQVTEHESLCLAVPVPHYGAGPR